MVRSKSALIAGFTSTEREYIRRELDQFFNTLPTVAEGFQLKTWRGGAKKGQPKLPPTAKRAWFDAARSVAPYSPTVFHGDGDRHTAPDDSGQTPRRSLEIRTCA